MPQRNFGFGKVVRLEWGSGVAVTGHRPAAQLRTRMSFLTDLAHELADAEAFEAWRTGTTATRSGVAIAPETTAVLVHELLQVATLSAVVTSVLNAREKKLDRLPPMSAMGLFFPVHTPLFDLGLQRLASTSGSASLLGKLQTYRARFDLAVRLSPSALPTGSSDPADEAIPLELVADAWRRLCRASLEVEADLTAAAGPGFQTEPSLSRDRTRRALAEAANGGWPCLDASGQITLPGWAERRRAPRVAVSEDVVITVAGRDHPGHLLDLSDGGAKLQSAAPLAVGAELTISRSGRPRQMAVVQWVAGDCLGVSFRYTV